MSRKNYSRSKGRASGQSFFGKPKAVMEHVNYLRLKPYAIKLLDDLGLQYNGFNNGDLCAAWSLMEKRGWKSKETLNNAIQQLLHYGIIVKTREGGRNLAALYALSWQPIDECKGKLDVPATTKAPGTWKEPRPEWLPKRKKKTGSLPRPSEQLDPITGADQWKIGKTWVALTRAPGSVRRNQPYVAPIIVHLYILPRQGGGTRSRTKWKQIEMPRSAGTPKTGGRKPGTPNKRTRDVIERMEALNCDPIEGMASIAVDARAEGNLALAGQMYKELAQYLYPKRKAAEVSDIDDKGVTEVIIRKIDARKRPDKTGRKQA